ncbi:MAG: AGE family epimerase/isomerase [Gemmatimonadota bacterium]
MSFSPIPVFGELRKRLSNWREDRRPETPTGPPPTESDFLRAKASLERLLLTNILPFWLPRILDEENGGFHLNHDVRGTFRGEFPKSLVGQARSTWFFARLARSPYGDRTHLDAATHGFTFLRDRMWDAEHGGFFWATDASGRTPTHLDKHLFGQAYGLYALSEYARAAADPPALALARELFLTLDGHSHDPVYGGYEEFYRRDWAPVPASEPSYMHAFAGVKQLNTHLHWMEALTEYLRLSQDPLARDRLLELILVQSNAVVRKTTGACTDRHELDWTPIDVAHARTNYGHDLENVWLLWEACDAASLPNGPLLDLYRTLFGNARKLGFDRRSGGFFYTGSPNRRADIRVKIWWVQAEALVCALLMYRITGEASYYHCFSRTLDWVLTHQADWECGDWHAVIGEDGAPAGDKATNKNGAWKTPYHNGRAVLRCLELLEPLIESDATSDDKP